MMPSQVRPKPGEEVIDAIRASSGLAHPIIPNHRRIFECAKESQLILWFWHLLDDVPCYPGVALLLEHELWDGSVLCRLMNAIKPGSVKKIVSPAEKFSQKKENIESFLSAVTGYGVGKEKLFETDDLLLFQNIPRVTECLFELGRLVSNDPRCQSLPRLGEIPYEPIDPRTKRRAGMPEGDDIHVAHVDINMLKRLMLLDEYRQVEESRG